MHRGTTMTENIYALSARRFALTTAIAMCSIPVVAQEPEPTLEEIIVEAPWLVEREVVGRSSSTGAPIEEISLTRRVDISDLDLTHTADVSEAERRIEGVARDSCDKLAEMFPLSGVDEPSCVDDAVENAMAQVEGAVADATEREEDVATAPEQETRR